MSVQEYKSKLEETVENGVWNIALIQAVYSKAARLNQEHFFVKAVEEIAITNPAIRENVSVATDPLLRSSRASATAGQ